MNITSQFLETVQDIVLQAGKKIAKEREIFESKKIQHKSSFDLVSYVDIETEKFLINELTKLNSSIGFIAEESHQYHPKEWNWIIDPLDGTTNFTRQLPAYAISVALAHHKDIKYGWVYNIPANELFFAENNNGAYLNANKISVAQNSKLADCLIATGFSVSKFDKVDIHLNVVKEIIQNSLGIRRMGAAAVDLCYVACGRFDAFFEWYLNPWDVAAGSLIAQEAGAIVSDFSCGKNFLYGKEILTAQPLIYQDILHIIQKYIQHDI
ncbi:MAG: inositol monophosphatase [Bacteroidia bacterium]|nr:MAG: inositol monophosphatase [Bacteroidia bacterium]